MVLFVFEGVRPEENLFNSIDNLFLHIGSDKIVCTFHTNIYQLYKEIYGNDENVEDVDTVSALKSWLTKKGDNTLDSFESDSFSEIYLFFDYDPHAAQSNNLSIDELNDRVGKMLKLFDNETEHGKLYISYPMSEAFRHTQQLRDRDYYTYKCSWDECRDFKNKSAQFSYYKNMDFVSYDRCRTDEDKQTVRNNWKLLFAQNVAKANYICSSVNEIPQDKNTISQDKIFDGQLSKFIIPNSNISILSAFPLFMFEYLSADVLLSE